MVDTLDSKSNASNSVRVRVSPAAPQKFINSSYLKQIIYKYCQNYPKNKYFSNIIQILKS